MKKICPAIFLLALLSASHLYAQGVGIPHGNPSAPPPPRAETTLSKAVVRITGTVEGVGGTVNGTGFIVSIPEPRLPGNPSFSYLVTNRHVAEAIMPDASGNPISHRILQMQAIVNLKTAVNGTKAHAIPLPPDGALHWHFPADGSIDLAVIPVGVDETYDVTQIAPGIFLTENLWWNFRVVPGDKVMTCGYFVHYAGAHQFQPIVREGSLAMVPDDSMAVPIGGRAKVYLTDLHIIPGNSGSPLFLAPAFTLGGFISDSQGSPYGLLGIVSGYMWEDSKLTLHAATDYEGTIHANSGIAMVVPVDQLKALLDSPELQRERDIVLHSAAQRVTKTEERIGALAYQPIATATATVEVTIATSEPISGTFRAAGGGGYLIFANGNQTVMLVSSPDFTAGPNGKDRVQFRSNTLTLDTSEIVGKPMTVLKNADRLLIGFRPMMKAQQHVLGGRAVVILNGALTLEFEIPPQDLALDFITVQNIAPSLAKLQ